VLYDVMAAQISQVNHRASVETLNGVGRVPRERWGKVKGVLQRLLEHFFCDISSIPGEYSVICQGVWRRAVMNSHHRTLMGFDH
jgi:hypothetical protein